MNWGSAGSGLIITRMVINMDKSKLSTIEKIEAFLGASAQVALTAHAGDTERFTHISRVLRCLEYPRRNNHERSVLLAYLRHTSTTATSSSSGWYGDEKATAWPRYSWPSALDGLRRLLPAGTRPVMSRY